LTLAASASDFLPTRSCVGFDELEIASRKQLNQRMIFIELIE